MSEPCIEIISSAENISDFIYDSLLRFNEKNLPNLDEKQVAIVLRDRGGIVGGLTGTLLFKAFAIKLFWLEEGFRNQGFGRRVFDTLEMELNREHVEKVIVDTYTFQAPEFYKKLGFNEVGRYRDYPTSGVDKIFYEKTLASTYRTAG
jgi:ribosomal protein S18 acetylase RimI-like enzyme